MGDLISRKALEHYRAILKAAAEPPASKEVVEYTREAIAALEKQVVKQPVLSDEQAVRYAMQYTCPSCGGGFSGTGIADYCYHCGQRLEWEGAE